MTTPKVQRYRLRGLSAAYGVPEAYALFVSARNGVAQSLPTVLSMILGVSLYLLRSRLPTVQTKVTGGYAGLPIGRGMLKVRDHISLDKVIRIAH